MARDIFRYIGPLPPVDWELLLAERRSYRHPPKVLKQIQRTQAVNRWKRLRAAKREAEKIRAERRKEEYRRAHPDLARARFLEAMQPGCWYGRPDIRDASGLKRNSVHALVAAFEQAGWLERAPNPEWEPIAYPKGTQIHHVAKGRPPQWLFRLTPAGEAERERRRAEPVRAPVSVD